MQPVRHHSWQLSAPEAMQLQCELATQVAQVDRFTSEVRYVAGVDVAYGLGDDTRVYAVVVNIDLTTMQTVEQTTAIAEYQADYVPGLFAFRELPALCEALSRISQPPDLIICDGQGVAHPRRCGIASHLGLLFDVPTIGCGKTRLLGEFDEPEVARGSWSPLIDGGQTIGSVLRTQANIKPLFISVGHCISLPTARDWILRLASEYRQPEPIRRANQLANECRETNQPAK